VRESAERLFEATGRPVFLAGLSMGGLLAIDLALAGTVPVAAVASLAAPLRLGRAARGMSKLANTQDWAESFSWPKFRGSDIANRLHMPGADGIPFKALSQLEELIEDVRSGLPRLSQPLLIVQSRHDHTSPPESPWEIASLTASSYTKLVILKRGFHIITRDICCEQVAQEVRQFAERFCVHESQTQNKAQNKG
jgi:carboxylesterase